MEREGWIKDYRKEIDSDIWVMPPLYLKVWQYLKYMVNHKPNSIPMSNGTKELIDRGQHLTSYRSIAKGVSYYENRVYKEPSPKTIKKILDWLVKNNMIAINNGRGNRQYTKVTIVNYSVYQDKDSDGVTQKEQSGNSEETDREQEVNSKETDWKQTLPINKNDKNDKRMINNEKNEKEGKEKPPTIPSLSFPTPYHKKIFESVSENTYRTWFNQTQIKEQGDVIEIITKGDFFKQIIRDKYSDKLQVILGKKILVKEV